MRCSVCESDKAAGEFTKNQSKKAAGDRKCTACAAVASAGAGNKAVGPTRSAEGGGATCAPTGGRAEPPAPSAGATTGTGGGVPAAIEADRPLTAPLPPLKVCSWVGCGKELSADPDEWLKCGRCKRAYYCDRSCQKRHWKQGGHKQECLSGRALPAFGSVAATVSLAAVARVGGRHGAPPAWSRCRCRVRRHHATG